MLVAEPGYRANWGKLAIYFCSPMKEIVISGSQALEMLKAIDQIYLPNKIMAGTPSKSHLQLRELNPRVGGPQDLGMLFSTTEIAADFNGYDITLLEEREMVLEEGRYHEGKGSVIRFIGIKPGPNLL